ncbi:hypothetical protein F442_22983, partial [Phytophthora nicotianae P10297]
MVNQVELLQWYIMTRRNFSRKKKLRYLSLIDYVERPLIPNVSFDLARYTNANCEHEFRFDVAGVHELFSLLRIPDEVVTVYNGKVHDRCPGIEALCIMLRRLATPMRYYDMLQVFGSSRGRLSRIFLHMIDYVHDTFSDKLYMPTHIVAARINDYCAVISAKGAPMDGIFGFPDGTKLGICRPSPRPGGVRGENLQRHCYSGHKRCHCLNYQAVTAPDGLCIHFWGPMEGRRHDTTMLRESKLIAHFHSHPEVFEERFLYGDPAYGVQDFIISGYKGNGISDAERQFNREMSRLRESVEWNFKCLKTLWPFVDYKRTQKIRLSPVGKFVK